VGSGLEAGPPKQSTACQRARSPTVAGSTKRLASRFYQLKRGHCLSGQYLHWTKNRATPQCWWRGYRTQTRDHLLKDGRCSRAVLDFLSSSMHPYWIMAILFTMEELGRAWP